MPFSSLLFLFLFFSITMFVYSYFESTHIRNRVLVVSSLVFYVWASPKYMPILFAVTLIAWFGAKLISNYQSGIRTAVFVLGIFLESCILLYFKYINEALAIDSYNGKYLIPVGISFYVLRLISYLADVYRKKIKASNSFMDILVYSSIFHLSIAAPMVRYGEIAKRMHHRQVKVTHIGQGINRFTIGLFKVSVFAVSCDLIARKVFPTDIETFLKVPAIALWMGAATFMVQIYLTFSGYSDMAIGMGRMVGFRYKENFEYPYMAKSIRELCSKWYITLSEFLKDYIYLPVTGKQASLARKIIGIVLSEIVLVIWIGRNWNGLGFVIFYTVILILEYKIFKDRLEQSSNTIRHIYTLLVAYLGWIIFRFSDVEFLSAMFKGMFGLNGNGFVNGDIVSISLKQILFFVGACIACTSWMNEMYQKIREKSKESKGMRRLRHIIEIIGPVVLTILSAIALMGGDYTMFLYF